MMAKKKQTLLILLGISFGTLLFVSISGVQLGMRQYVFEQLLNNTAHILISGAENDIIESELNDFFYGKEAVHWVTPPFGKRREVRLQNYQGWYERLSQDPAVFDFSPRLRANALLTNGKFTSTVGLTGTIPERHLRISSIDKYIRTGSFEALKSGGNRIVIGSGVAKKLGARLNDFINISVGTERATSKPFKVVGVAHFGNDSIDDSIAFAHLTNVQVLTKSPGRVTEIAVALTNPDRAAEVAESWQAISSDKVQDWQQANKMFMEMIKVQDFTRYFITSAILIVAAFGIYNVLSIMINQKRREIAILRAIGYPPNRILELVLYQGLLLGIAGGIAGLALGFLMCKWIESINFGFEIGGSNHLLVNYDPSIYITALVAAFVAAIIASYFPAWAASRMTPMDIIRSAND